MSLDLNYFPILSKTPAAWREVPLLGGSPGASSAYSWDYKAEKGFVDQPNHFWTNAYGFPASIWYDFGAQRVAATKISFQARNYVFQWAQDQMHCGPE